MESPAFDASLTDKPAGLPRLSIWRIIRNVFRALELCLALLLVVWISARLPLAVRFSCHCLWSVLSFAARPLVVFVLSNVIIGTVVAKSCRFSGQNSEGSDAVGEFYDEIAKLNGNRRKSGLTLGDEEEEVVYQDKEIIISEISALAPARENHVTRSTFSDSGFVSEAEPEHSKANFRRTWSEEFLERSSRSKEGARVLRRSETEKCRSIAISGGDLSEMLAPEEELSSEDAEEFQRTIEAFIAKQLRFRREESMAIVLQTSEPLI